MGQNTKIAANNEVTPLFRVDMQQDTQGAFGATLFMSVECSDGQNVQCIEGSIHAVVVRAGDGTFFTSFTSLLATVSMAAGTLTLEESWTTDGDVATFNVTVSSSLNVDTITLRYLIQHALADAYDCL